MLRFIFLNENISVTDLAVPAPDRLYIAPEPQAEALAAELFPMKKAVPMPGLAADQPAPDYPRATACFDALFGNLRVLYQDAPDDITIAMITDGPVLTAILSSRLETPELIQKKTPGTGLVTHAGGSYLVIDRFL